jgi:hypothetical protein
LPTFITTPSKWINAPSFVESDMEELSCNT